jgi:hypothetical protein
MGALQNVHSEVANSLSKHFPLQKVQLKYPFPVRPPRVLGMVKLDGEVYSTDKLQRVVCMRITLPVFMKVYSTFIRPKIEYDLPAFLCEVVYTGSKLLLVLDVHRTGDVAELEKDKTFFDDLMEIRGRYDDLLCFQKKAEGSVANLVQSRATCRLGITAEHEERALTLVKEYLDAFAKYVTQSQALGGEELETVKKNFETYLQSVVEHDPGVKGNKVLFGKKEGVKRAMDIFYGL